MTERPVPTVQHLLWRDFLASLLSRLTVSVWGFVIVFELIGRFGGGQAAFIRDFGIGNLLWIAAGTTAIGVPLLIGRLWRIRRVFSAGDEVPGTLTAVERRQAVQVVWVEFRQGGAVHEVRNAVKRPDDPAIQAGAQVTVFADPDRPGRGFVREIYVD